MKRSQTPVVIGLSVLSISLGFLFADGGKGGEKERCEYHNKASKLDVDIAFYDQLGHTITDSTGIYYYIWDWSAIYENKVYPEKYWGAFPLYLIDYPVGITVNVTNKKLGKTAKLHIRTEAYELHTDGSNGISMTPPQDIYIEVGKGETKTIDASFTPVWNPDAEGGLDRFLVKVSHLNEGGGPGNEDPALIMIKEGIFCPPHLLVEP